MPGDLIRRLDQAVETLKRYGAEKMQEDENPFIGQVLSEGKVLYEKAKAAR